MRVFVFAVGGTGARVLRSLTMLMAAGVSGLDDKEIVPIIVDCDKSNGDKARTIECLKAYAAIHNAASPAEGFFASSVTPLSNVAVVGGNLPNNLNDFELNFGPATNGSFADNVDMNHLTGAYSETKELLNLLYDNSTDPNRTELNLGLQMGFKGNPNIGSVVFNDLKNTPEFRHFERICQPGDRIFVISSIFGGTGASGFPAIIQAIKASNSANVRAAKVGALVMLPYFKVISDPTKAIDSDYFNSKTKAALSYYEDSGLNQKINSIYYVADDNNPTSLENEEGATNQINGAHIAEMVAALGLVDFCKRADVNLVAQGMAYEFGIDSNASPFDLSGLYRQSDVWGRCLAQFAFAAKYYQDVIKGRRAPIGGHITYYDGIRTFLNNDQFFNDFDDFIGTDNQMNVRTRWDYKKWLDEMKNNTHSFNPFDKISSNRENVLAKAMTHKELSHTILGGLRTVYDVDDKDFAKSMDNIYHGEIQKEIAACGNNHDVVYRNFLKMLYQTTSNIVNQYYR